MDRRGFFKLFGAGVAGIALEQAIPLGRVWSFPTKIVVPEFAPLLALDALELEKIRQHIPTLYEQEVVLLNLIDKHAQPVPLPSRRISLPITHHMIVRAS